MEEKVAEAETRIEDISHSDITYYEVGRKESAYYIVTFKPNKFYMFMIKYPAIQPNANPSSLSTGVPIAITIYLYAGQEMVVDLTWDDEWDSQMMSNYKYSLKICKIMPSLYSISYLNVSKYLTTIKVSIRPFSSGSSAATQEINISDFWTTGRIFGIYQLSL